MRKSPSEATSPPKDLEKGDGEKHYGAVMLTEAPQTQGGERLLPSDIWILW